MTRILVLGGYGVFGSRIAERLVRDPAIEVIIAGRNLKACEAHGQLLRQSGATRVAAAAVDALTLSGDVLRRLQINVVINTVGPFQAHDYRVARAAIAAGAHYIDIADARGFVTGITALDAEARAAGVLVVSGASSVPALAAAIIDELGQGLDRLDSVTCGISPGNSFDPGLATGRSIIGALGRPFMSLTNGRMSQQYGWQPIVRHRVPGVGTRWFGACDAPDLDLFPVRYPSLRTQRFVAGVEVKAFHAAVWAMSWIVRAGLLRQPERLAGPLLAAKRWLSFLGSDRGVMFVVLDGRGRDGQPKRIVWDLAAWRGHGPYIPATPAVIVARGLAAATVTVRGAMPCVGLMTHEQFTREVADLDIRQTIR